MSARDGDGWIQCACGNKHWGLNGAAGILLIRGTQILLQHRAPWVHNGDTWGIPGGARDSHESVLEAAIREAKEETGINPVHLTPIQTFSDDHGSWRYDTVIAYASDELVAHELNDESHEVRWVEIDKVDELTLHPSFEKSWTTLKGLVQAL
ncbi:MAG: NUDIX hydrolase [Actinobacteria bacterium]|jgi:8-oxo-dGTP diphosphatase|nr:NUDIX hydrolase [Actinomycetota bacterium]